MFAWMKKLFSEDDDIESYRPDFEEKKLAANPYTNLNRTAAGYIDSATQKEWLDFAAEEQVIERTW